MLKALLYLNCSPTQILNIIRKDRNFQNINIDGGEIGEKIIST